MNKTVRNVIILSAVVAGGFAAAVAGYNALSDRISPSGGGTFAEAVSVYEGDGSGSGTGEKKDSGKAASDFLMLDDKGENIRLSDHFGKPVILNFWATWCPPCRAEMPDLEESFRENGEEIEFMAVNLTDGYRDTKESVKAFVEENGYTFPVYYDSAGNGTKAYNIMSVPTTVFIREDGTILTKHMGALTQEKLQYYVNELLDPGE